MIQVYIRLTFVSLEEINAINSFIKTSVLLDLWWDDELAFWNESLTPGAGAVRIPSDWLWSPDLQLYDAAENFEDGIVEASVEISTSVNDYLSYLSQSRAGIISSVCKMDLDLFPFDKQVCTLAFGSFTYPFGTGGMNISLAMEEPITKPGIYIEDSFKSLSWVIEDVQGYTGFEEEYGHMAAVYYDIYLKRDSAYYYSTAIIPNLAVSIVALMSMWIADISSRLGVAITAMLAVIAVMVSYAYVVIC